MRIADQEDNLLRSKVSIISTVDCPPIEPKMIQVLFPGASAEALRTMRVQRPTYFDQLCTVIVEGPSSQNRQMRRDVLRRLYQHALYMDTKYGSPLRFDRPIFDTRAINLTPNNVAHLLFDIIPSCLHARHCLGSEVSFVFEKLGMSFRELLSIFGIDPIVTHKRVLGPIVHIRGTRGLAVYDLQDTFDCQAILFFPNTYHQYEFNPTVQYDKVFFSRRDARALENHYDVERLLTAQGYTTVYMEDFSILDQISIAAHTRHVVSIHGAAMAFLVFNRKVDSLIELSPPHVYHALFPVALGPRVRKYILIIQEFDERIIHNGWNVIVQFKNRPFKANLGLLERALAEVEVCAKVP
jgi:hypothetical protein